ncbi:DUF898 family protein [Coralliovum pocilloporae]|uniref:DUF898 family protein n=1 Tax=Coralliovum pocilloporae TaxID=3066369 RepID=UPI003306BE97
MENEATADAEQVSEARDSRVFFWDEHNRLSSLALKGSALLVLTLGIYRFWYTTHLRQFFWGSTKIDGAPLEYTGRAVELLIGFLIALAILVPVYVLFFIGATFTDDIALALGANGLAYVLLFLFAHYAIYRARRYRLNRTIWKGLRFRQEGSAWTFTGKAIFWWFLVLVTLGLAYPWKDAALERYKVDNSYYGNLRLSSSINGRVLLKPFAIAWVGILLAIVCAGLLIPEALKATETGSISEDVNTRLAWLPILALIAYGIIIVGILIYIPRRIRAFINATNAGGVSFESTLKARSFFWAYFLFFLIAIGVSVVGGFAIALLGAGGLQFIAGQGGSLLALIPMILGYVGLFAILNYLGTIILQKKIWEAIANTMTVRNVHCLDEVQAAARQDPSLLNQGLADALDTDLGVGF